MSGVTVEMKDGYSWTLSEDDTTGMIDAPISVFIDDMPLEQLLDQHEAWARTGGASGARQTISGVDFRLVPRLSRRVLSTLSAEGGVFFGLDMQGIELQGANLAGADLRRADLRGADLRGAKLIGAKLAHARLESAKLGPLDLGGGRLLRTDLTRATLNHADLSHADLTRARMLEAGMDNVRDTGCNYTLAERE